MKIREVFGCSPVVAQVQELSSAQRKVRLGFVRNGTPLGVYFNELRRIGHCGFVEVVREGEWVLTIEGNTSPDGSREGIGVFRRLRHKRTICRYSNWL